MRKQLSSFLISLAIVAAFAFTHRAQTVDDGSQLVGDWTGESICVGSRPACHDEKVVYHIKKVTGESNRFKLSADKIIDGKAEWMYDQEFKYDGKTRTLAGEFTNSRFHGLWEYLVKGDEMEGTLKLLPDNTVVRRIKVKKVE